MVRVCPAKTSCGPKGGSDAGQGRGPGAAAEVRRHPRHEQDQPRRGEGRQQADPGEPGAEERLREARRHRDERRLVHVAPGEVLPAGEEVELVAEEAVAAGEGELEGERQQGQHPPDPRRAPPGLAAAHAGSTGFLRRSRQTGCAAAT
jgi:hypothetical protein